MTIKIDAITAGYDGFRLKNVTATIEAGSLTAVIGPNGCGKSTLLKTISRQIAMRDGKIFIADQDLKRLSQKQIARQISVLPQHPVVPPGITVEQLVGYGRAPYQNLLGMQTQDDRAHIEAALDTVSVSDLRNHVVSDLSGGQRQRVFIAMCIAQDTPYILMDEPTSFLDIRYQYDVLDLMAQLNKQGKTVIAVLHDINHAARYASNLMIMKDGQLHTSGHPADTISEEMLIEIYGIRAKVFADPVTGTAAISPIRDAI